MTTPAGPSGTNPNPSGDSGSDGSDGVKSGDKVDYETHRKLLGEKKALAAKQAALEAELEKHRLAEAARQEKALEEAKDYEKLKAQYQEQLELERKKNAQLEAERVTALKLDAFFGALDGQLDRRYWGLIDTDAIVIDPATKRPDEMAVTKYIEQFRKEYPEVIARPGKPSMPNDKPIGNGGGALTLEQWKALPLKEMKARLKDVKTS